MRGSGDSPIVGDPFSAAVSGSIRCQVCGYVIVIPLRVPLVVVGPTSAGRLLRTDRRSIVAPATTPATIATAAEPDQTPEHRLPATDRTAESLGRRGGRRDAPGILAEHVSQVAFEIVHVSSLLGMRSRSVSIARATIDRTAAAEHPSASPACCSDRSA